MVPPVIRSPHPSGDDDEAKRPHRRDDEAQRLGRHGVAVDDKQVSIYGHGGGKDGARDVPLRPQPSLRPARLGPHVDGVVVDPDEVGDERGRLDDVGDEEHVDEHQEGVVALVAPADVGHRADRDLVGAVWV